LAATRLIVPTLLLVRPLFRRTEDPETGNELRTAAKPVAVEGELLAVDEVMRRSSRNRTFAVSRDRATAGVSHARYRYAVDLEVGGTAADYLTAV